MSAKHLVIGLDGADLSLLFTLGRARLPNLFALMDRGVFAHQRSVEPPATLPNWTTFLTGVDPGTHGVFDFTLKKGYGVRFTAGTIREAPTMFARLDRLGLACACVGFPATYPPERLQNGVFISGWDSPVAFQADASFVWPRSLYTTLTRRFGPLTFDEVDQFAADRPGFHARLGTRLVDKIERRTELARYLLNSRRWDAFAFYFGESDTASHYLWSLFDEGSPRRPKAVSEHEASGLIRVYEALDRAVGVLVEDAGVDPEITIVSDHGSAGSSDKVLFLNRALEQAGLLSFKPRAEAPQLAKQLKRFALERFSPKLRDSVFRAGGALLSSWLESRTRFSAIDMSRTSAFSDELNYFPAVWLNMEGREPKGVVSEAQREEVIARVSDALLKLRDPWTKRPVISAVRRREELYKGPWLARAPDLILELKLDRGYSYNVMPTPNDGDTALMRKLDEVEFLGKKGRSLPGAHRPEGLFIAAGPKVNAKGRLDLRIEDASALFASRMGGFVVPDASGLVPEGVLRANDSARVTLPDAPVAHGASQGSPRLEARLRALGYID